MHTVACDALGATVVQPAPCVLQGKAPGLMGWWPGMAVTFTENHDTGSTQQHWPFPSHNVGIGYAYILTHPGEPVHCLRAGVALNGRQGTRGTAAGLSARRLRN